MTRRIQPCGTYGAYQRHQRNGEPPCDPCRAAARAYQTKWRRTNPELYAADQRANAARARAAWRLTRDHPDEFRRYVIDELNKDQS